VDHDTVLGRLLDLCDDDCALVAVLLVEIGELRKGVVAGDVGVEDEEGRVVLAQDVLGELQGTGGAEGLRLDGECDGDVVLLFVLGMQLAVCSQLNTKFRLDGYTDGLECLGHDLGAVVDSEDNIRDTSSSERLNLVLDHRLVRKLDKRLGVCERLQLALAASVIACAVASRGPDEPPRETIQEASDGFQTLRRE
jgi:hypothetical protein